MGVVIYLFLFISFFASANISARHVDDVEGATENPDDDIDLEKVLEDYYDSLAQIKKILDQGSDKKERKEEEKKEGAKVADYDYMSDMPSGQPEGDDKCDKEPCTKESDKIESLEMARAIRESYNEMSLEYIKNQILNFRGGSPAPNATLPDQVVPLREIYEKNMRRTHRSHGKVSQFLPDL